MSTTRQPRFEVVHTGPRQFHARFRAANGEIVWTTESYRRRRAAYRGVELLVAYICEIREGSSETSIDHNEDGTSFVCYGGFTATYSIREVDER